MFRRLIAAVVVMAGLTAALVVPASATDFPAATTPLVSWNMQGANNGDPNGSKWSRVQGMALQVPILMLQEVGPQPPNNSSAQPSLTFTTTDSQNVTHRHTVLHNTWRVASSSRSDEPDRQVYFLPTADDATNPRRLGGRVNTALVLMERPDELIVVGNPVDAGRNALGARFGNEWYFTFHGLSGGGGDSGAMLNAIDDRIDVLATERGVTYNATVGGDFNVEPQILRERDSFPPTMRLHGNRGGLATHIHGHELDYFATTHFDHGLTVTVTVRTEPGRPPRVTCRAGRSAST
ncbi:exonuclease/endonuclease/phosphatase family protein [Streptomyces sp. S6]